MRLGGLSKKLMAVALSSVMVVSGFAGLAPAVSVSAADDTAKLRMIFTSDLHGQLTTEDYETGKVYTTGGLSRTATSRKRRQKSMQRILCYLIWEMSSLIIQRITYTM